MKAAYDTWEHFSRVMINLRKPGNVPSDAASGKLIELQNAIAAFIEANPTIKINNLDLSNIHIPSVP